MIDIVRVTEPGRATTLALALLGLLAFGAAGAQTAPSLGSESQDRAPPPDWTAQSAGELEELVGPIALYPDDLVAVVLPAATFPLQIVQAARYLEARESDPSLQPDDDWDESVVALLNYPEALALLNEDLDRTWALGEAVIYQQGDVLDAIQAFRDRAHAAGNLESDDRQTVADDGETITIEPAEPEVVYVPYYDPGRVVIRHSYPVYSYYPRPYPVYYYPYPAGHSFRSGFFWGVTTAFGVSWHDHFLHVRHHSHFRHPYYGHRYHLPYYARNRIYININHVRGFHRWRPSFRHGGRPGRHWIGHGLRDRVVANARLERLARQGRLPRTAPRSGRMVEQPRLDPRRFSRGGRQPAVGVERRVQPRHRIRQAEGRPPSNRHRVAPNETRRAPPSPTARPQRARNSDIRAESRFSRPRGNRESLRVRSRAPRLAVQGNRARQIQRRQGQAAIHGGGINRARAAQRAAPETRSATRPRTFGRVAGTERGARQGRPVQRQPGARAQRTFGRVMGTERRARQGRAVQRQPGARAQRAPSASREARTGGIRQGMRSQGRRSGNARGDRVISSPRAFRRAR